MTANADQIALWNRSGPVWVELQDRIERQLGPIGRRLMALAAPRGGERVVDVGCGCGGTTLELVRQVAPLGQVLGVDVSRPMLEEAERRRVEAGLGRVTFMEADAETHPFEPGQADLVFSRFGVMFFADPAAAFANLASALKPGGRLAFVCWTERAENPMFTLPAEVAAGLGLELPQIEPGPFSLADPDRIHALLDGAGLGAREVRREAVALTMGSAAEAAITSRRMGPLGAILREGPKTLRDAATAALEAAWARHAGADGQVVVPGAVWQVLARRP